MKLEARGVSFRASREHSARGTIQFDAETTEHVEGMRIDRSVRVPGEQGDFHRHRDRTRGGFSPLPFSGYARFRDPKPGPVTWEGPLAVTLPGLAAIPLAGAGFTARLCPRLSIFASCLPQRERARIRKRYGSGSHSQPLALARLSSLR